jgi:adenylate cyclase
LATHVLFSFAVVLAIRFIGDTNHLLGQNVLLNFITGHYRWPRLEQRVSLIIDIEGSTAFAERLGESAFYRVINRFVVDIAEPIVGLRRNPRICRDRDLEIGGGIADAQCVRACFDAFDRLAALTSMCATS